MLVVATEISACGGRVDHPKGRHPTEPPGAAAVPDASVVPVAPDATVPEPDASVVVVVASDAGYDHDAVAPEASAPDANVCVVNGALAITGDYVATDGTAYWLRRTATATTYTVVPPGPATPAALPSLFRVTEVCTRHLSLAGTDGTFARLDWVQGDATLRICVRPATTAAGVGALPAPDESDAAAGCAGAAWLALTKAAP